MSTLPDQFEADAVTIRLAEPDDHPRVRALFEAGLVEGQLRGNDTGADIDHLHAGYFADDGASAFWVASHDSVIIGMIGVQNSRPNTGEIRRLRVESGYRRRGIGTLLMYRAIEFCRQQGYLKITLDVRIEREPALTMFSKFGFAHARSREIDDRQTIDFYLDLYRDQA